MKTISLFSGLFLTLLFVFSGYRITAQNNPSNQTDDRSALGFDLPFSENWESHSFTTNNWSTSGNEWEIDIYHGNEGASAKFRGSAMLSNYSSSLTSDWFNAVHIGKIYLKYDLMLTDLQQTGTEWLITEVFDGTDWIKRDSVSNTGSFSWQSNEYEITQEVKYQDFKIRFRAKGQHSNNLLGWYIDNVEVYSVCNDPPKNLTAQGFRSGNNDWGVQLNWDAPELPMGVIPFFGYDNGYNYTGIGLSDGGDFTAAIRWDAGQLSDYDGTRINEITMYIDDATADYFIVKIWTDSAASTLIYQDTLSNVQADKWNIVQVNDSLIIDSNLEYWIGYEIVGQQNNTFPAGADAGPAVSGYGDMIKTGTGDWTTLSGIGLDYNWNLEMQVIANIYPPPLHYFDTLIGFNIYRAIDYDTSYSYLATEPFEEGVLYYEYKDYHMDSLVVCYKVNALWKNSGDTCYSAYATSLEIPIEQYVCMISDGIDKSHASKNEMVLFPNPAKSVLTVKTESAISEIFVFDLPGKKVLHKLLNAKTNYAMDVSGLPNGLYILKVKTEKGFATGKFVLDK